MFCGGGQMLLPEHYTVKVCISIPLEVHSFLLLDQLYDRQGTESGSKYCKILYMQ